MSLRQREDWEASLSSPIKSLSEREESDATVNAAVAGKSIMVFVLSSRWLLEHTYTHQPAFLSSFQAGSITLWGG